MFVTCFYNIYNNKSKIADYIKYFHLISSSGIKLHLYTEPELVYLFEKFPKNITVIGLPLKYVEMYQIGMNCSAELAAERSQVKDTREFFSLMNSKLEFIMRSMDICEDEQMAWIDFAIFKLFDYPDICVNYLKEIEKKSFDKLYIPGCWFNSERLFLHAVHWRFCGSFLIGPRDSFKRFFEESKGVYLDFINIYKGLTWETNIWCCVEFCNNRDGYIKWYKAYHNDSMFKNLLDELEKNKNNLENSIQNTENSIQNPENS